MACKCWGYNVEQGTKAFCVAEIFVGLFNVIRACDIGDNYAMPYANYAKASKLKASFYIEMILEWIFVMGLSIQGLIGITVLYPIGFRNHNITINWIWIIVAAINFVLVFLLWLFPVMRGDWTRFFHSIPILSLLYLLYIPYGIFILVQFNNWCRATGVAVQISLETHNIAQDQSSRPSITPTQDHEHKGKNNHDDKGKTDHDHKGKKKSGSDDV